MRDVIIEDRTWLVEEDDSDRDLVERLASDDPVAAAKVDYGYARI